LRDASPAQCSYRPRGPVPVRLPEANGNRIIRTAQSRPVGGRREMAFAENIDPEVITGEKSDLSS
jgi:hypothetical protein